MFNSLYARLSITLLALVILLGTTVLWIAHETSEQYSQEVTQRLNGDIAMYVTGEQQLIEDGHVNQAAVDKLAQRAMTINPTVEIYLVDAQGRILTSSLSDVVHNRISLVPVKQFLSGEVAYPIYGDDPRHPTNQKVFSVSPILEHEKVVGYLYAVLGGKKFESLQSAVDASYILQMGAITIIGSLLVAVLAAITIFFFLTRRLSALSAHMNNFDISDPVKGPELPTPAKAKDEIDYLSASFIEMATKIKQQFVALQSLDATRRELIANVSHDLRTPLASMQGYIETLMIKDSELSPARKQQYLATAHKHSLRLNALIAELFELAKLDSGTMELNIETFSLMELVHDSVQEFELLSAQKNIKLSVEAANENCYVCADIALIQRVLQNLLGNALEHTPADQSITIRIKDSAENVLIEVSDTGRGIAKHEIPHIFERYYFSHQGHHTEKLGSGLGLAIVKRILELHKSSIAVRSELNRGTIFSFELPLPA